MRLAYREFDFIFGFFFSPLYIPFSFLSLASVEQLRISVAWGIPGNLSLLAMLAEC